MNRKMLPAALMACTLAFSACGDDESGSSSAGGNGTDRAFVAAMIPHHESAIEMARIAQDRGESAFVKQLADDIVRTQDEEIAVMRREDEGLETAGVKTGSLDVADHEMGMEGDPAELREAEPFDEEFMTMMIDHHEGAITMAEAELDKGSDPELMKVAEAIVSAQEREIAEMRKRLGDDVPEESMGH